MAPPVERLADRLEAPELDDRAYRVIRLPNQLEALLVHDPETDKASASVNVKVGNFSDDPDMPGMAHAVEHLLFMGTKKYPVENDYSQYLTSHSGYSNAYTASTETNYFFEVAAKGTPVPDATSAADNVKASDASKAQSRSPLYGALDRFAQFFIAPLFLRETLDRELQAVDSENKKNLQSDNWRLAQLDKSLSNPKHPYSHFSTGNLATLRDEPRKRGVEIRQAFIDFHAKHYSANRMKLVVLGRESLDELESWIVELFSAVPDKNLPENRWDDVQPYTESEKQTQIFAKPVMESRTLDLHFAYRDEEELFRTQPSHYLSHLIGHEGPGSILAYIKAKGWANSLSAGDASLGPGAALLHVSIRLTPDGLTHYRSVVETIFHYIAMLNEAGPQKWVVEEMKGMAEVDFRFKQKTPASAFTSKLSSVMQKPLPREWLLSGSRLIRDYDATQIAEALEYLRPDNFRITVVSQDFPGDWNAKERWYGTEYRMEKMPSDFMKSIAEAAASKPGQRPKELHLPHPNEFIPTRLSVERRQVKEPLLHPMLIRNDQRVRLWWKKDDRFWVPKGSMIALLRTPLANVTPANAVKTNLFTYLVKDALNEYSYDAEIAGLEYDLSQNGLGLSLEVTGYNDKMPVLLAKVVNMMRELEVKPDRFRIIKERLARGYRNTEFQQPYYQIGEYTRWLSAERSWINEQFLAELEPITLEDVTTFFPQLLDQMHLEVLAHGNLHKEDALRMVEVIEKALQTRALPPSQWPVRRDVLLPPGSNHVYRRPLRDPANVNNCIEYVIQVGRLDDMQLRAKTLLLGQLGDERGFDQLRTKEQLGYVVFTGAKKTATAIAYRVVIQSERTPEYLEERINAFLVLLGQSIKDMSAADFEGHKRSLVNKRLERLKNLDEETGRFWTHIHSEHFHFTQNEADAAQIEALTQVDMLEFFARYIDPRAPERAKVSVHLAAQTDAIDKAPKLNPEEQQEQLLEILSKFLSSGGIGVDKQQLAQRFECVDVSQGDVASIISALTDYLEQDAKEDPEQIEAVKEQGPQILSAVLPGLGIKPATAAGNAKDGDANDLPPAPEVKPATTIDDVPAFKATLSVGPGPQPVSDLHQYEEMEPKL